MSNVDQFVDEVYDELVYLNLKDKNYKKYLLGNEPIKRIFDIYSDWLANNISLSPKIAANIIYKDVINVGYVDFQNRKIKRGATIKNQPSFNLIYGSQKEIDQAIKLMTNLKNENSKKYYLILNALELVKDLSDTIKPQKNIFGKTTNIAKQNVSSFKMPRFATLTTFIKMNENELKNYILKLKNSFPK